MRAAIDAAVESRWLEPAPDSGPWPCDAAGAAAVTLQPPAAPGVPADLPANDRAMETTGVYASSVALDPSHLQDLVEVLPDVVKAAAGVRLQFRLSVTVGDGGKVDADTVEALNALLREVAPDLRLNPKA